ncbi:MAG: class I SAM-dependent methyltransferase [Candidatus Lokiarchaeota archaeon]|nr:class I SAM-dependent methyltransferase [Candidatus Lokiarchaeota archaeon]
MKKDKKFLSIIYKNDRKSSVYLDEVQTKTKNELIQALKSGKLKWEYNYCYCSAKDDMLLSYKERRGLENRIVLCKKCGLIRANPRISEDTIELFYTKYYRTLIRSQLDNNSNSNLIIKTFQEEEEKGKRILENIQENLSLTNGVVFDFGAGAGGTLQAFKNAGYEIFGVDLNLDYLKYGVQKGLNLKKGGIEELKKYPKKADLIIISHILEHIHNLKTFLSNLKECLKDEGYLFVALPGLFNVQKTYGNFQSYFVIEHLYYFSLGTLKNIMAESDFTFITGNEEIQAIFQKKSKNKAKFENLNFLLEDINIYLKIVDLPLPINANTFIKNKNNIKNKIIFNLIKVIYKFGIINLLVFIKLLKTKLKFLRN